MFSISQSFSNHSNFPSDRKSFQKILAKQGIKFKLNTKVLSADKQDNGTVAVKTEAAKGGKEETLEADVVLVAVGRRPYTEGLGLDKIGVEVDNRGRIVIDDQYNTSVKGVKCIGDVTFGPMLAHKAEEEGKLSHPLYNCHPFLSFFIRYRRRRVPQVWSRARELRCNSVRCVHASGSRMGRQERTGTQGSWRPISHR